MAKAAAGNSRAAKDAGDDAELAGAEKQRSEESQADRPSIDREKSDRSTVGAMRDAGKALLSKAASKMGVAKRDGKGEQAGAKATPAAEAPTQAAKPPPRLRRLPSERRAPVTPVSSFVVELSRGDTDSGTKSGGGRWQSRPLGICLGSRAILERCCVPACDDRQRIGNG